MAMMSWAGRQQHPLAASGGSRRRRRLTWLAAAGGRRASPTRSLLLAACYEPVNRGKAAREWGKAAWNAWRLRSAFGACACAPKVAAVPPRGSPRAAAPARSAAALVLWRRSLQPPPMLTEGYGRGKDRKHNACRPTAPVWLPAAGGRAGWQPQRGRRGRRTVVMQPIPWLQACGCPSGLMVLPSTLCRSNGT